MAFSNEDQQHWISVAKGMVTEFLAARAEAAQAVRKAAATKSQGKRPVLGEAR